LRTIILILTFSYLLLSCKQGKEEIHIQIEDKKSYARKLADLYFIEAWITRAKKQDKDSIRNMLSNDFEKLHKISLDDFYSQLDELKTDPIVFSEIMDSVGVILKNKGEVKKKIDSKKEEELKRKEKNKKEENAKSKNEIKK